MRTNTRGVLVYLALSFLPAWLLWEEAVALGFSPANPSPSSL